LEHPDATIRLRTLGLLHAMADENNTQIIVINMLRFFQRTKNERIRTELADRITTIASQFSPSPIWFARTMERLFTLGGEHVRPEVAFAVLQLIEESCDEEMQRGIVNLYIDVVQNGNRLSDVFVIVIVKVIGQFGELSDEYDLDFIALLLCDLADAYEGPRAWVLNALLQTVAKLDEIPHQIGEIFETYKISRSIIVQEICFEGLALLSNMNVLEIAIGQLEEPFDEQLSFLDDFVNEAIRQGKPAYIDIAVREGDLTQQTKEKTLKMSYTSNAPEVVYGAPPKEVEIERTLDLTGVLPMWGENGLLGENLEGLTSSAEQTREETPVSIWGAHAIKPSRAGSAEARKDKVATLLFGQKTTRKASTQRPVKPMPIQTLTEEDHQLIDEINGEIEEPIPQQLAFFLQSGSPTPVYESGSFKVAAMAQNGGVLLAFVNEGEEPILGLKVGVIGPDVLIKETASHPKTIRAIPQRKAVWLLTTFKFPQHMKGFPDFKFTVTLQYVGGSLITIALADMSLATFVIPLEVTTQQFSGFWKIGGIEQLYRVPTSPDFTLDEVSQTLNELMHVKTVQRIGNEEIFAGILFSTPFKILLHVKFSDQRMEVKVLTKAPPLTQAIVEFLKTIFG
jgi:AP-4 complex subunit epsilon-1